jgi:hypothetical protein
MENQIFVIVSIKQKNEKGKRNLMFYLYTVIYSDSIIHSIFCTRWSFSQPVK